MLFWLARLLLPGVAVVLATWVGQRLGATAGGILLAFPFVIGSGLVFAMARGSVTFQTTALGALRGLIPLALFLVTVAAASRWLPLPACLALGGVVWLGTALPLYLLSR